MTFHCFLWWVVSRVSGGRWRELVVFSLLVRECVVGGIIESVIFDDDDDD